MTENQVWIFSVRWTIQNLCYVEPDMMSEEDARERLRGWMQASCKKWVFQLEDTVDNLHFQGYINVNEKVRAKTLAKSLNDDFRGIEIRPASGSGKLALQKYCMKVDTRVDGPWADHKIYMGQDLPVVLYPWQQKLCDYIKGPVNRRELIWVYDPDGNKGKSAFCKYMSFHHGCLKLTYGNSGDLLNLVSKRPGQRAYLFDLTRTKPQLFSTQDLYSTMEDVKNGHFVNTKYETEEVLMDVPHVIVFANQYPEFNCVSEDRWTIVTVPDQGVKRSVEETRFSF